MHANEIVMQFVHGKLCGRCPLQGRERKGTQQGGKFGQKGEGKENIGLDPDRGDKMFANDSTQKERNVICKKTQRELKR